MRRRFMIADMIDYSLQYFTIEALEDGLTISLSNNDVQYRIDNELEWNTLNANTKSPSINKGHTISFKGLLQPSTNIGIGTFTILKFCNVKGNIMSLLYGDNFQDKFSIPSSYHQTFYKLFYQGYQIINANKLILPATELAYNCYQNMFEQCINMVNAPQLPATTLISECYNHMFAYCSSLIIAPELPATVLARACYNYMFNACVNLTKTPALQAYKLAERCYRGMFNNCTNINNITMLATDISAKECLSSWVNNVASTGTFVKHPNMNNLPTGSSGIPTGWTVEECKIVK